MVYSNLTGTTAKEFAVGHGKDTERKVVTTAAGAQITNKDGTLVPVEVGAPQKTTDAMQKGTADNTYASKAQGEKADTALQKLAIGTVQKGDDAQVTASTSGTTSTLNFVLPKGDPGTSGVDGERGTKWFYGTDIATDVTEDAFVGDTFVFIEDAVTRASVSSRRGDLLVCTVAGAPGIAEWEYRMNIIGPSGSIWYFGTDITGTSTTGTIFDDSRVSDAYVNDKYLNTDTSNVYSCVTPGDPWTAEWIYIGSIKGEKGETGDAGASAGFGTPTASATTLAEGASPTINISSSGENTSKIFDFKFGIPKGATGAAAGFGTPTATATTLDAGSDATVNVTSSGSNTAKVFNFTFGIPKGATGSPGAKGDTGEKGATGNTGAAAGFGTPTASATSLAEGADPTVTITPSGPNTAKIFAFSFGIPKGATGAKGATGNAGATGTRGSLWYSGTAITGTSTTGTIFSSSGIASALVNDKYLNTSTGNVYNCTTAGAASVAKWQYIGSIKGVKGDTGSAGAKGDTGAQGPTGAAAGFGTPTASVDTLDAGENATVSVSSSGANTAKIFNFKFGIPKGATGEKGATGNTGAAAGFGTPTASATQLAEGASPTVSVTSSGGNTAKVFNFTFGIPKGATGSQGVKGDTGEKGATGNAGAAAGFGTPTASASALTAGSTPTVTITPSGPNTAKIFNFKFGIPSGAKGDTGAQGPTGAAAGFGTPTASATPLAAGSNPTVTITPSGPNTAKIFNFTFGIPRGATGAQGATGNTGAAAGFGTPTASATQLAEGASPTVSVTSSGSNTAKVFNFEFGIPKGATGSQGATGNTGATGTRGSMWYSGTAITGTAAAGTIFSSSGITNALVNDKYLNTLTGNVYNCATPGAASVAKWQYIGSIKGAKGDTGSAGAKGDTGAAAGFGTPTATATTLDAGSDATVSVTSSGSNTAKVFNFTFGIPKGAQGLKGDTGSAGAKGDTGAQGPTGDAAGFGTPIASATPLAAGSAPTVTITPSGPNTAKIFNFTFGIPRGATGEKGATGNAGAAGTRGSLWYSGTAITGTSTTGTIFSSSGIASALVNDKYLNTSTGNVYNCTTAGAASVAKWQYIGSIKGAKGDTGSAGAKGDTGAQGATGAAAGFGTPTATATKLAATANPTVTITPSGSNTAKVFAFSFGIPQGAQGATGPNAVSSSTTTSGFTNGYMLYNNNGKVGAMIAGNIHIDAVTSTEVVDDLPE